MVRRASVLVGMVLLASCTVRLGTRPEQQSPTPVLIPPTIERRGFVELLPGPTDAPSGMRSSATTNARFFSLHDIRDLAPEQADSLEEIGFQTSHLTTYVTQTLQERPRLRRRDPIAQVQVTMFEGPGGARDVLEEGSEAIAQLEGVALSIPHVGYDSLMYETDIQGVGVVVVMFREANVFVTVGGSNVPAEEVLKLSRAIEARIAEQLEDA